MENQEKTGSEPAAPAAGKSPYMKGLLVVGITSGYIFGPMIVFGAIGWWLSNTYDSLLYVFGALIIALAASNFLIFRNTTNILERIGGVDSKKSGETPAPLKSDDEVESK